MSKSHIKLIAAVTMLIDHIGYILFPQVAVLRYIGRVSFPLFAFCVGDGCRYSKKPLKYLLRVFLLGLGCQLVFACEELFISRAPFPGQVFYFNVLFTFSLSIILCILFLRAQAKPTVTNRILFIAVLSGLLILHLVMKRLSLDTNAEILFDYELPGMLLPLFAVFSQKKEEQALIFSVGVVLFALLSYTQPVKIFCTLAAVPVVLLYNAKAPNKKLKYAFYIFYPAQFLVLYGIDYLRDVLF